MFKKNQVQFHETFQPQAEYISAILELACCGYSGTKESISERTGIPTGKQKGKVVPHLKYAQYMGLLSFRNNSGVYDLKATPLGERVYIEDPYLLEGLTRLVCNYFLTDKQNGAPQWSYIFHTLPHLLNQPIDSEFLKDRCNSFFGFPVDLGVVKNCYQTGMFEGLRLLNWTDKGLVFNRGYISRQNMPVYAYTLISTWERILPDQREIPLPMVLNELGWGAGFGFDEADTPIVIDALADEQYVQVNRQLFPVTVVRFAKKEDLLAKLYSNLI